MLTPENVEAFAKLVQILGGTLFVVLFVLKPAMMFLLEEIRMWREDTFKNFNGCVAGIERKLESVVGSIERLIGIITRTGNDRHFDDHQD